MTVGVQHSVSVAAVVVDASGRVLVTQRRDNGKWEPPGGVLELGESIVDGVSREVLEETGLRIAPERLTGVYKNMPRGIVALVFRAHVIGGEQAAATGETTRIAWLSPDQVDERCDEAYAVRIHDALADSGTAVRAHDGVRLVDAPALPPR